MSQPRQVPFHARPVLRPAMLAALSAIFISPLAFAFSSGSTGADGALAPTVNTTIDLPPSGILNYTTVNIPTGVTVRFRKNALNTPVYLLASGNVSIVGAIAINGLNGTNSGTAGDGVQADDGIPGVGGPGGFDGGRGGREDTNQVPSIIRGGAGLGPGGGRGGIEGADSCTPGSLYQKYVGGSAGYATAGNPNALAICGIASTNILSAGVAYGSQILQPLIGGSGGGGGRGGPYYSGSGGGGGGGALLIASSGTVTLSGSINASGGNSGDSGGTGFGGPGGGGSGGAVRIVATAVAGAGSIVTAAGCTIGSSTATSYLNQNCAYYSASVGRVRIEGDAITYSGTTTPSYVPDVPGPIFLSSLPTLRIASVAGSAVPANPTGVADVTLPANIVNPVTVSFETANVPQGNTVLLKVIPAYGLPIEAITPAITGTTAAGTASVQVSLPQGPSTLQATTTYTVVVAMGEALSRFAQNERVEKVQLIATLGGESQAKLITISGKEFVVPASVLQMVGFAG